MTHRTPRQRFIALATYAGLAALVLGSLIAGLSR